jgi:deazaflavin-dependent oxidoreductase (nitroreductase family)
MSSDRTSASDSGQVPPRWVFKTMTRVHVMLHRLTFGRFFNTLTGDEVCFVSMTGARSGRLLTIPLMYVPHQGGVLLVASQGGAPRDPVWHKNLVKTPDIEVDHRGQKMRLRARLAAPEEKVGLWPVCDSHYAPFEEYRARTDRDIPIFVCEPIA